jgi:arsenite methyltransferase
MMTIEASGQDQWARWLLERRFGGDAARQQAFLDMPHPVRDRVLEHAAIREGNTVLDVGAGDGLIAFGAISLVGEHGTVIFSDISQDLLDISHSLAEQMGVLGRVEFLRAPADDLSAVPDASVDVLTTRSVLIYVDRKREAFREFFRVLRPGGRLSIFEPINRFGFPEPPGQLFGYDVTPIEVIAAKVRTFYDRVHPPDTDSMLNFDERDLLAFAQETGFREIHLAYQADIGPNPFALAWDIYLKTSFNPRAPTLEEAMRESLTPAEAAAFEGYFRPLMDAGPGTLRSATTDLWATKR